MQNFYQFHTAGWARLCFGFITGRTTYIWRNFTKYFRFYIVTWDHISFLKEKIKNDFSNHLRTILYFELYWTSENSILNQFIHCHSEQKYESSFYLFILFNVSWNVGNMDHKRMLEVHQIYVLNFCFSYLRTSGL